MPAVVCIEEREDVGADYGVDAGAGVVEINLFIKGKYEEMGLIGEEVRLTWMMPSGLTYSSISFMIECAVEGSR
jgi:hypothetical protein